MRRLQFILMVAAAGMLAACWSKTDSESEKDPPKQNSERATVLYINAKQQQLAGIVVQKVIAKPFRQSITVPGTIDFNQQRLAHLTSRIAGRVEQVYAFVGDRVKANDLLATIYSQSYLAAQSEFIQASQRVAEVQSRRDSSDLTTLRAIEESARRKLIVMGAKSAEIEEIARTHVPKSLLEIRSPLDGSVTDEAEILGHVVDVGTTLFHVANLEDLWVIVDIYEKDLAKVKPGNAVTVRVAAYPNESFAGHLMRIFDVVDEKTRTIKARAEVRNRQLKLKPKMFGDVEIADGTNASTILLPTEATVKIDNADFVFVQQDDTMFVRRPVVIGLSEGAQVEIKQGLREREVIAVKGAFYLKSQLMKEELGGGE